MRGGVTARLCICFQRSDVGAPRERIDNKNALRETRSEGSAIGLGSGVSEKDRDSDGVAEQRLIYGDGLIDHRLNRSRVRFAGD